MLKKIKILLFFLFFLPVILGCCKYNIVTETKIITKDKNETPVVLLDFDGEYVYGTVWNFVFSEFYCEPVEITSSQQSNILQLVREDYRPFNIIITTDEELFFKASYDKRIRVIVTNSSEFFGKIGGISYVGSLFWGDDTPSFVFPENCVYLRIAATAISHEIGHAIGLKHQSVYDIDSCKFIREYRGGKGVGITSASPIMGDTKNENMTIWSKGLSSDSCTDIQDDILFLTKTLGLKPDDYSNSIDSATELTKTKNYLQGIISNNQDVDYFYFDLNKEQKIKIICKPLATGANDEDANLDILLKIYDKKGNLIKLINRPDLLSVETEQELSEGKYYISIQSTSNLFADNYGMVGSYKLLLIF